MKKVFVIHGRDYENLSALQTVLTDDFGMQPVVLKELPDAGLSVIEKFEKAAADCCHAVVLLSPDDHSVSPEGDRVWQPRQNVVFELGWFCGKLGRNCITWLCKEGTHLPSDFNMVMTQKFTEHVTEDTLLNALERELRPHGVSRSPSS